MVVTKSICVPLLVVLVACELHLSVVNGAKILAITMPEGKSHFMSMLPLMQKLASEGHQISVYYEVYKSLKDYPMVTNQQLLLDSVNRSDQTQDPIFIDMLWNQNSNNLGMLMPYFYSSDAFATAIDNHRVSFDKIVKQDFDIIVVDSMFTVSGVLLATKMKKPYVIFCTSIIDNMQAHTMSMGWSPAAQPPLMLHMDHFQSDPKIFYDRLYSTFDSVTLIMIMTIPVQWIMKRDGARIDVGFDWDTYYRGSQLFYYDYPDRLQWPMPLNNQWHSVGAVCETTGFKPLPKEMSQFVEDPASKGTIVIAFGTMANWAVAPAEKRDSFVKFLELLPDYRIVWSYDNKLYKLPKHIHANKWIPQVDLLNHPKTILFISHGGLKSFKEALCSETPVAFVPMFAEQLRNALMAKTRGFAERLHKLRIGDTKYMLETVRKVLEDPSYIRNAKRVKAMYTDRLIPHMDEAAFYTNQLIKYKRLPDLMFRKVRDMNTVQHWNLDWIIVLSAITFVICTK